MSGMWWWRWWWWVWGMVIIFYRGRRRSFAKERRRRRIGCWCRTGFLIDDDFHFGFGRFFLFRNPHQHRRTGTISMVFKMIRTETSTTFRTVLRIFRPAYRAVFIRDGGGGGGGRVSVVMVSLVSRVVITHIGSITRIPRKFMLFFILVTPRRMTRVRHD